mmetsp:Transcript_38954/g.63404  ORF Transcript_38954/g.63404 Transcript_38954/m.63404 type:complete len:202 (+) Transcript_38954:1965-2570(+)
MNGIGSAVNLKRRTLRSRNAHSSPLLGSRAPLCCASDSIPPQPLPYHRESHMLETDYLHTVPHTTHSNSHKFHAQAPDLKNTSLRNYSASAPPHETIANTCKALSCNAHERLLFLETCFSHGVEDPALLLLQCVNHIRIAYHGLRHGLIVSCPCNPSHSANIFSCALQAVGASNGFRRLSALQGGLACPFSITLPLIFPFQ